MQPRRSGSERLTKYAARVAVRSVSWPVPSARPCSRSTTWRCRCRASRSRAPARTPSTRSSRKSFIFFRNPRPDAYDPETGERYDDVIVFWVAEDTDKQALVEDDSTPFFTTPHFKGHPSVLLRGSRIGELTADELAEVVYDAWLARAGKRAREKWLAERGLDG